VRLRKGEQGGGGECAALVAMMVPMMMVPMA
jgi:hypothetical protein